MSNDIFLKLTGQRQGWMKGESLDRSHQDEIEILEWNWGLASSHDLTGGGKGKHTFREMRLRKRVDVATTRLMNALKGHEIIKNATLSVRKAGKEQHDYFVVTMEKGYVTAIDTESVYAAGVAEPHDVFTLSFSKVNVEYLPQGSDGLLRGASTFQDELGAV